MQPTTYSVYKHTDACRPTADALTIALVFGDQSFLVSQHYGRSIRKPTLPMTDRCLVAATHAGSVTSGRGLIPQEADIIVAPNSPMARISIIRGPDQTELFKFWQ